MNDNDVDNCLMCNEPLDKLDSFIMGDEWDVEFRFCSRKCYQDWHDGKDTKWMRQLGGSAFLRYQHEQFVSRLMRGEHIDLSLDDMSWD
jgi:hypothetical protein